MLLGAATFEGGQGVVGILLCWWLTVPLMSRLRLEPAAVGQGLAAVVPLMLGFCVVRYSSWAPIAQMRARLNEALGALFAGAGTLDIMFVSLLAGVGEELLFRGALQGWLTVKLGTWPAIGIASVVFGLAHFLTPAYAVFATLAGVFFGWLYSYTDNLVVPMLAHFVYDWIAIQLTLRFPRH